MLNIKIELQVLVSTNRMNVKSEGTREINNGFQGFKLRK